MRSVTSHSSRMISRLSCVSASDIDFRYRKSPKSTVMWLPHRVCTASRPRRSSDSSMMSSWTSVAVWMNSITEAYSTARSPRVARHARGHQQHRRPDPLAAAVLDVVADRRDQRDLRLDVARELALDLAKIVANRLEQLGESDGGRFLRGRDSSCQNQNTSAPGVSTRRAR